MTSAWRKNNRSPTISSCLLTLRTKTRTQESRCVTTVHRCGGCRFPRARPTCAHACLDLGGLLQARGSRIAPPTSVRPGCLSIRNRTCGSSSDLGHRQPPPPSSRPPNQGDFPSTCTTPLRLVRWNLNNKRTQNSVARIRSIAGVG
jgi:hypothetical protein